MNDTTRFGESRDSFSAGRVYWMRGLAIAVISVVLSAAVQAWEAVV